jgi:riboflavin kinase/FMN adenylyltransferase
MKIHRNTEELPSFQNAVITIGTFDGVHMGHRQIIDKLKTEAKANNGETVIITFHPHPRKVVSSAILGIRLINTLDERIELLEGLGIDHLVVVPFTDAFANQPAEDYIKNFLVEKFNPATIIIGYDHRFGRDRLGDYRLLEKTASEYNFSLKEIPKHILENISISSTNIRRTGCWGTNSFFPEKWCMAINWGANWVILPPTSGFTMRRNLFQEMAFMLYMHIHKHQPND